MTTSISTAELEDIFGAGDAQELLDDALSVIDFTREERDEAETLANAYRLVLRDIIG